MALPQNKAFFGRWQWMLAGILLVGLALFALWGSVGFAPLYLPEGSLVCSLATQAGGSAFCQRLMAERWWVALGWVLELFWIRDLAQKHLPQRWLWLLLAFLFLTDSRYLQMQPEWVGGLLALFAVWFAKNYLKTIYTGSVWQRFLGVCGVLVGLCVLLSPITGLWLALGLTIFSLLHCFLHEREEKGISYRLVSNPEVLMRWGKRWGLVWGLPLLATCGVGMTVFSQGMPMVPFGMHGASQLVDDFGYFSSFHREFEVALQVANLHGAWRLAAFWGSRCMAALHLLVIGLLPILGILGNGYILPNRFIYRLLRLEDEELLLYWVSGVALVLSTLFRSTSAHLVDIGALPFMMGFLVLYRGVAKRPLVEWRLWLVLVGFLALLLLGRILGMLA